MYGKAYNLIPRQRGKFLWSQFLGGKTSRRFDGLCAMFDEVDEGTAIFKCANNVPIGENSKFITFDGLPSDYYLKMVGASAKLIRGESSAEAMPGGLSFSSQSNGAAMLNIP